MPVHKLYLIPSFIGNESSDYLPQRTIDTIHQLTCFIVEREKTARAFLNTIEHPLPQADFTIHQLDKHNNYLSFHKFLDEQINKADVGLLSEAGLPAIADPGSELVAYAHKKSYPVIPLAGSSSLFLALMASGFNGQKFSFNGYLPIQKNDRIRALKDFERASRNHSQIFIEAPYRNDELLKVIKNTLQGSTQICIACDLESDSELIHSCAVSDLIPDQFDLHKRPCIFILMS